MLPPPAARLPSESHAIDSSGDASEPSGADEFGSDEGLTMNTKAALRDLMPAFLEMDGRRRRRRRPPPRHHL